MKRISIFLTILAVSTTLAGCSNTPQTPTTVVENPHAEAQNENQLFLNQKSFDPWVLITNDPDHKVPAYLGAGHEGFLYDSLGNQIQVATAGAYDQGMLHTSAGSSSGLSLSPGASYSQTLNLQTGTITTRAGAASSQSSSLSDPSWPDFWKHSDIQIAGDPEAQQVTHAELFYLCSSLDQSGNSVPPMGLSSTVYDGHIFWDAEIWMMPALLPQHPELAKSIVDYRFRRLPAARALAKAHNFLGAEFPWESASSGKEEAPAQFSHERHITADVAYAAWQYYLWSGDKSYLVNEAWPLLQANAQYWSSRAKLGPYDYDHIADVMGPDENAGEVTDDAYTNAIVQYTLKAAVNAGDLIPGTAPDKQWSVIANRMYIPFDKTDQMYLQFPGMDLKVQQAKQADTQMLIYPLNLPMSSTVASNTLDYYLNHTISFGPAMTSCINAIIAAKLGRAQQSLDLFHDSYRPFMRGPWDAFSEKRTKSDVYFTTGMGGCLQAVLYGFAGLNVAYEDVAGQGTLVAKSGDADLYVDPHLPSGWTGLTVKGVVFRGKRYDIAIVGGNKVTVSPAQ